MKWLWEQLKFYLRDESGFSPLLAGAIGLLASNLFGGGGQRSSAPDVLPEQRDLLRLQRRRLAQGDPLSQAVLRLAFGLLPRFARRNIQPLPPGFDTSGDSMPPLTR